MKFADRIKKEMAEGIVRAILEDAGYRVVDYGIEKQLRELACMTPEEYRALAFPDAMRHAPDFAVMDRDQTEKFLVEVKYRTAWGKEVFADIQEQVRSMKEIVLVSIFAGAPNPKNYKTSPARFIRCCALKWEGEACLVEQRRQEGAVEWTQLDELKDDKNLWWSMSPLHEKFPRLGEKKEERTLFTAIESLAGILNV